MPRERWTYSWDDRPTLCVETVDNGKGDADTATGDDAVCGRTVESFIGSFGETDNEKSAARHEEEPASACQETPHANVHVRTSRRVNVDEWKRCGGIARVRNHNHLQAEEIKGRSKLGESGLLRRVELERDEEEDERDPARGEVDICDESVSSLSIVASAHRNTSARSHVG